jgi:hypothetical protein
MPFYRQRGVLIDAVQFTGRNVGEVVAFAGGDDRFHLLDAEDDHRCDPQASAEVWDCEHGRWVPVRRGDWVVRTGPRHTVAPIERAEFTHRYELDTPRKGAA